MSKLFTDQEYAARFDRDGFIVLDLLADTEIERIRDLFFEHNPDYRKEDLYESSRNRTDEINNLINDDLRNTFTGVLRPLVGENEIYGGSFMVKPAGSRDYLPLHQDWSIVEEDKFQTAFVWCPLQETNSLNGGLFVVPGSHLFFKNRKSGSLPSPRVPMNEIIRKFTKELHVRPGEAVIYDVNLFHGSHPNTSNSPRIIASSQIVEAGAPLTHYARLDEKSIGVYYMSKDLYLNRINELARGDIPEGAQLAYKEVNNNVEINERSLTEKLTGKSSGPSAPLKRKSYVLNSKTKISRFFTTYTPTNIAKEVYFRLKPQNDHPKKVGEFYNQHHDDFIEVYGELIQAFRTTDTGKILDYEYEGIGLKEGMTVLDAGCGVCKPAIHFAAKASINIKALTVSKRQLEHAEKLIAESQSEGIELYHEDYHKIDQLFESGTFDKAYFLESFGHSSDKKNLLRSLWKVLKPGGEVYIKDLFIRKSENKLDQNAILKEVEKINDAYHYQVPELSELIDFSRSIGFILVFAKTIDIPLEDFENLTISNKFQELTGIYKIESFDNYIFPVDFMEIKLYKPAYNLDEGKDRYFLQNLFHQKPNG